ncbi:hypothetical protein M378DRAFT_16487 [Amanita muscaria Koide BX008]|uniref:Uncharacterized protein n=1 Tax=Amanita muscaria (strain Koide BX008) TaxID=946122 RepID=A0A0C2WK87_AMAMK|nr:hypothetical protein M378DRAFT_16487 [Amanita muscaria Koide BX008]
MSVILLWLTSATDRREALFSTDFVSTSSANAPLYGSATPSGHAGTPPDYPGITSVIVGGVVGGAVSFVVLLLALYMIRVLSKRRSGLRSTTTESSSRPPIQATSTIATAGTPYGSDQSVRSSMESAPPPYQPMDEIHEEQVIPAEMDEAERGVMQKS